MRRPPIVAALLLCLTACGGTRVDKPDDTIQFGAYRRVAILPFSDERGQGRALAEELGGQLKRMGHYIVDVDDVSAIVRVKADGDAVIGLESLEMLRAKTNADVLLLGRMAPDWSWAYVTAIETELGDAVIRAHVRPRSSRQKAFTQLGDCAQQIAAALVRR